MDMPLEVSGFPTNLHLQHFRPAPPPREKWSLMIVQDLQKSPFWNLNIPQLGRFFVSSNHRIWKKSCATHHLTTKTSCSLQPSFGINSEFFPVPVLQENPELPGAFCRPPKIDAGMRLVGEHSPVQNLFRIQGMLRVGRRRPRSVSWAHWQWLQNAPSKRHISLLLLLLLQWWDRTLGKMDRYSVVSLKDVLGERHEKAKDSDMEKNHRPSIVFFHDVSSQVSSSFRLRTTRILAEQYFLPITKCVSIYSPGAPNLLKVGPFSEMEHDSRMCPLGPTRCMLLSYLLSSSKSTTHAVACRSTEILSLFRMIHQQWNLPSHDLRTLGILQHKTTFVKRQTKTYSKLWIGYRIHSIRS